MTSATMKTALLFGVIIGLFIVVGGILGAWLFGSLIAGLLIALALGAVFNLISYFFCDKFVIWSSHAKIVTAAEAPRLAKIVDELAPKFGLVKPRLALIPSQAPNAFATGRNPEHAIVAATEGILRLCDDRELRGVLAHELAHVKDRDILVMTFAATVAGAISFAAQMVLFQSLFGGGGNRGGQNFIVVIIAAITAPIAALLIQLAISRSRELHADEVGAMTIGDPNALADALQKLEEGTSRNPQPIGTPATAALCIVNPLRGGALATLFSTHPPIGERIRILRQMASRMPPNFGGVVPRPLRSGARAGHA
ncbi:MAG: M48 family metalloprotease [Thermoplasmata archaeon]|nr:M48 family metalloprotease [Thermoplasmata archaeon]